MAGPLSGLGVVEMAGLGPCPLAGQLLCDMGASVTVIDRRSDGLDLSDVNRRGKRSIAINLKSEPGQKIAFQLIKNADVLLEGFRPGVMERLGLGPEACLQHNPKLVYARITGWGQDGPLSTTAGHDINYLAITGALAAIGTQQSGPVPPLNLAADYAGGTLFLLFGVLSALYESGVSGKGQVVDAAMCDGVPAMMGLLHQWFAKGEWNTQRENNILDGGAPFYRCYLTSDQRHMSVGALEPEFYSQLIDILQLPNEFKTEQYDRAHWQKHCDAFVRVFIQHSQSDWTDVFSGSDACVAPVLTLDEVDTHPHNQHRKTFVSPNNVKQAAPAPRFSRSEVDPVPSPGAKGAESESILQELGFSSEVYHEWMKDGVLT